MQIDRYNLDILPVVIGLIIIIAILVPAIKILRTYKRQKRVANALPDPQSIERSEPGMLDEKRSLIAANLLDDWSKLPEDEIEVTRHALWTAMLLVATSDGTIDHREMRFVAELFSKMAGKEMDFRPVVKAAELVQSDKKNALTEISMARRAGNASKEHILAGAFLVSVADHALAESETDCLGDIADALAINQRERKVIFQGFTKRFGF